LQNDLGRVMAIQGLSPLELNQENSFTNQIPEADTSLMRSADGSV